MKTIFTPVTLQKNLKQLFDSVDANGLVTIKHRSRDDMILIDKKYLDEALTNDKTKAVLMADLTL